MIPGCFWIPDRSVSVQVVNIALSTQYHAEPKTGKYYEFTDCPSSTAISQVVRAALVSSSPCYSPNWVRTCPSSRATKNVWERRCSSSRCEHRLSVSETKC
jgi:hypothetical protein